MFACHGEFSMGNFKIRTKKRNGMLGYLIWKNKMKTSSFERNFFSIKIIR
jgi:hypothetical protein